MNEEWNGQSKLKLSAFSINLCLKQLKSPGLQLDWSLYQFIANNVVVI